MELSNREIDNQISEQLERAHRALDELRRVGEQHAERVRRLQHVIDMMDSEIAERERR